MALLLLALLPLALPWGWVCFGGLAGATFHLGVSMRWSSPHGGLTSGSSGSLPSRFEQLVSLQGASDSMAHFSPEGVVVISGSGIAVRALLLATSLTLTMVLPHIVFHLANFYIFFIESAPLLSGRQCAICQLFYKVLYCNVW